MNTIELKFPFPPSVNHSHSVGKRKYFLGAKSLEFIDNALLILNDWVKRHSDFTLIATPVRVIMILHEKNCRRRDILNYNKLLLDTFKGILWKDDVLIDEFFVKRGEVLSNNPHVEIIIKIL